VCVCLIECDLEKSTVERPRPDLVRCTAEKYVIYVRNQTHLLNIVYCKVIVCIDNQIIDTLRFGIHIPMFTILLSPSPKIDMDVFFRRVDKFQYDYASPYSSFFTCSTINSSSDVALVNHSTACLVKRFIICGM
jgi:hypothetical protein